MPLGTIYRIAEQAPVSLQPWCQRRRLGNGAGECHAATPSANCQASAWARRSTSSKSMVRSRPTCSQASTPISNAAVPAISNPSCNDLDTRTRSVLQRCTGSTRGRPALPADTRQRTDEGAVKAVCACRRLQQIAPRHTSTHLKGGGEDRSAAPLTETRQPRRSSGKPCPMQSFLGDIRARALNKKEKTGAEATLIPLPDTTLPSPPCALTCRAPCARRTRRKASVEAHA